MYGKGRDKSPLLPRLITAHSKTHVTFLANATWIEDSTADKVVSSLGRGNLAIAMGLHPRLGCESPLNKLASEILRYIVTLLA